MRKPRSSLSSLTGMLITSPFSTSSSTGSQSDVVCLGVGTGNFAKSACEILLCLIGILFLLLATTNNNASLHLYIPQKISKFASPENKFLTLEYLQRLFC